MATACYIPGYFPASYKGFAVDAMTAGSEHGRRGAEGEFPFGENTAYADLGIKIRRFTMRVRFAENSHIDDVNEFIAVCESPGSGPLSHPTRGIVQAACTSCKVEDDLFEEQGVTYVDLEFVEDGEADTGFSIGDSFIGLVLDTIIDIAAASFLDAYAPRSVPFHRRGALLGAAATEILFINKEYTNATNNKSSDKIYRAIADMNLIASNEQYLMDKSIVQRAITFGIGAVAAETSGDAKFQAMRRIANSAAKSSSLPKIAGSSEDAIYALTRITAGAFMAQAALESTFTTSDQAFRSLDSTIAVLGSEANLAYATCNNPLFLELKKFIVNVQNNLLNKAFQLPGLIQYKFNASTHPLAAAYDIYGDAKRHRELEQGNLVSQTGRFGNVVTGSSA